MGQVASLQGMDVVMQLWVNTGCIVTHCVCYSPHSSFLITGTRVEVLLDTTPFYAESGGQVSLLRTALSMKMWQ
jgi:hypothetical protein